MSSSFRRQLQRLQIVGLFGLSLISPHQELRSASAGPPPVASLPAAAPAPATTTPAPTESSPLLVALKQELDRSMKRLRLKGYEAPYFISYTLRDIEEAEVVGKFGAVFGKARDRRRVLPRRGSRR
jgi:TldD protein